MEETVGVALLIACNLLVAAVIVGTTWAAATGRLGLNVAVGIRTPATMRSDAAWLAGHRAAWPVARAAGRVVALLAVVATVLLLIGHPVAAMACGMAGLLLVLVAAIPIARSAGAAARAVEEVPRQA